MKIPLLFALLVVIIASIHGWLGIVAIMCGAIYLLFKQEKVMS